MFRSVINSTDFSFKIYIFTVKMPYFFDEIHVNI